ncbi:MAG: PqqD family protein [Deltaproteobacteria bacterium]
MFRINSPKVISNSIGGEVIIINLDSGFYYSLNSSAGALWEALLQGFGAEEICETLQRMGHPLVTSGCSTIDEFINELLQEELIISCNITPETPLDLSALDNLGDPPAMERFEDMQELLVLDPIHEVGETGWPVKKE